MATTLTERNELEVHGDPGPALRTEDSPMALMRSAVKDIGEIVRAELQLAKVEVREDARRIVRWTVLGAAAGIIGLLGLTFMLHAMATGLAVVLPMWASYLIVGGLGAVIAVAVLGTLRARVSTDKMIPERTLETLKENGQWIRQKLS